MPSDPTSRNVPRTSDVAPTTRTTRKIGLPDITLAQVAAAITWIAGQVVIMGVADENTTKAVLSIALTVLSATWMVGDAIIRNGRSRALEGTGAAAISETDRKI